LTLYLNTYWTIILSKSEIMYNNLKGNKLISLMKKILITSIH